MKRVPLIACVLVSLLVFSGSHAQPNESHRSQDLSGTFEQLASGGSRQLAISADGMRVAFGGSSVGVADYLSGTSIVMTLAYGQTVSAVAISNDGLSLAAYVSQTREVRVWDVESRSIRLTYPVSGTFADIAFIPESPWFAVLTDDELSLVSISGSQAVRAVRLVGCGRGLLTASSDGSLLAIGCVAAREVRLLETATGLVRSIALPFLAGDFTFDPTARYLAVAASYVNRGGEGGETNFLLMDLEFDRQIGPLAVGGPDRLRPLVFVDWLGSPGVVVAVDSLSKVFAFDPTIDGPVSLVGDVVSAGVNLTRSSIVIPPSGAEIYVGHSGAKGFKVFAFADAVDAAQHAIAEARASLVRAEELASAASAGPSRLFDAVRQGSLDDLQNLIGAGVDVNLVDETGTTLLMVAAEAATFEIVAELLMAGADATVTAVDGRTALHFAAEANADLWIVTEIVRFGGDPELRDARGVSVVDLLPADVGPRLLQLRDELRGEQGRAPQSAANAGSTGTASEPPTAAASVDSAQAPAPIPAPSQATSTLPASLPQASAPSATVWVEFSSDPTGLEVLVDGVSVGSSPVRVELVRGAAVRYRIEGRLPDVHPFEGSITPQADAVHPTYMTRLTAAERSAYLAAQQPPPAVASAPTNQSAATTPAAPSSAPAASSTQPSTRLFDSASGRPAPRPGESIRATPRYVVAFLANELEIREVACPPAPVPVIVCGITYDGEAMISSLVDALFDIYLQPSSREVRWYRDRGSNAYVGAFRRPEGVYAISIFGNTVSIGYVGP